MGLFNKTKKIESAISKLHNLLTHSFRNVQKDTSTIFQWLNYLYQKTIQQEKLIIELQKKLNSYPTTKEEIRKIVDDFYSYDNILARIRDIEKRMDNLQRNNYNNLEGLRKLHQDSIHELQKSTDGLREDMIALQKKYHELGLKISALKQQILSKQKAQPTSPIISELTKRIEKLEARKASLRERIIRKITKNSRDYIKSIIISYIEKYGKISALQLKEMVVEEQGLCSKSSFYRLLEEIEDNPDIGVIRKGKEKHYIVKIRKRNY